MLQLALLKLGFNCAEILAMPEGEAKAWIVVYQEMVNPKKKMIYKVVRKKPNG